MADGHVPVIDLGEMEVLPIILILINVTIIIVVLSSVWRENQQNVWKVGEIRGCGRKRYDEKEEKKRMKIEEGAYAEKGGFLRSFGNMGTAAPTVQISVLSSKLKVWYFTSLSDDRCTLSIYYWLRLSTIHYNKSKSSFTIQFKLLPVDFHLSI